MTVVVNLFGGPGTGKSTTASGVFYHLKRDNRNVELVQEYAKDLTWEKAESKLEDQLYITAKQNRRMWRLRNKVDVIVTDSPLLLGIHYAAPDYFPNYYEKLVWEVYNSYSNINIFLNRKKPYNPVGRNQTEDQAKEIDCMIKAQLDQHNVPYTELDADEHAVENITKLIKERVW
jgi:hypothetical protein